MFEWVTMQNITFVIAVAGFLMSAATWILSLVEKRKNLLVELDLDCEYGCTFTSSLYHNAVFAVSIENRSTNSIAITFIELVLSDGSCFRCQLSPEYVGKRFVNGIGNGMSNYERFIESAHFPIEISGLGAGYEYLDFNLPRGKGWDDISRVEIHTNRGNLSIKEKEVIAKLQEFLRKPF